MTKKQKQEKLGFLRRLEQKKGLHKVLRRRVQKQKRIEKAQEIIRMKEVMEKAINDYRQQQNTVV